MSQSNDDAVPLHAALWAVTREPVPPKKGLKPTPTRRRLNINKRPPPTESKAPAPVPVPVPDPAPASGAPAPAPAFPVPDRPVMCDPGVPRCEVCRAPTVDCILGRDGLQTYVCEDCRKTHKP